MFTVQLTTELYFKLEYVKWAICPMNDLDNSAWDQVLVPQI